MKAEEILENKIFSVSEFNEFLNSVLRPMTVTVEGEISDWRVNQGKFIWFNLKDEEEALQCFSLVFKIRQPVEDGMKVKVTGHPRIYGKSGRFSFFVEKLEISGEGSLNRSFEILRKKLETEGIFAKTRKRPLPRIPETIGLITSKQGAAYTDFIKQVNSRLGGLTIQFLPVAVQGEKAIPEIVSAFDYFNKSKAKPGVVVLTRGGGSLEDLKEFNSEEVVRAVFSSKTPIVCGIGHEKDVCLAELAADMRASTPTHAAQIIVPSREDLLGEIETAIVEHENIIDKRIYQFTLNLQNQISSLKEGATSKISEIRFSLQKFISVFENLQGKLVSQMSQLNASKNLLVSLSPESVLSRGYSIVRKSGRIVKDSSMLKIGDGLEIKPKKGSINSKVTKIHDA